MHCSSNLQLRVCVNFHLILILQIPGHNQKRPNLNFAANRLSDVRLNSSVQACCVMIDTDLYLECGRSVLPENLFFPAKPDITWKQSCVRSETLTLTDIYNYLWGVHAGFVLLTWLHQTVHCLHILFILYTFEIMPPLFEVPWVASEIYIVYLLHLNMNKQTLNSISKVLKRFGEHVNTFLFALLFL